ncbi:MAG: DUF2853 family protein [Saprospiraceae bacterium]|nr:DUF2853 family protein [Saprospiraceae bacterium]
MSKFDEAMSKYREQLDAIIGEHDDALLTQITKNLGPSIYLEDASRVSCSDDQEKFRVKTNFLIGKLGCEETTELDMYIDTVCNQMGSSNRNKYRAVMYYLLVVQLDMAHKIMN